MCDCRLSRNELLVEKERRIKEQQQNSSSSSSATNEQDANLKKLAPYPRDPNFLVFCSISLQQATRLIQSNENYITGALSEESIQSIFEFCCNPKWFCSECSHPVALHSTGVLFSTSEQNQLQDDEVIKAAARNASDSIISDERTRHFIFCCSGGLSTKMGGDVGGGVQKVSLAATAGWELQRKFDLDLEAAATEKAAFEKAEGERIEREKAMEEEEKRQHQLQFELFEKERIRAEAAAAAEREREKKQQEEEEQEVVQVVNVDETEQEIIKKEEPEQQQQQEKQNVVVDDEKKPSDENIESTPTVPIPPTEQEPEQVLSPEQVKQREQESEIQKQERTIRERIHAISLRYGQASNKDLSENSEIVKGRNNAAIQPRPPSSDYASARLQLQQQASVYVDEQRNKYRSVSPTRQHPPTSSLRYQPLVPPAAVPIHHQSSSSFPKEILALRGTVAPSIEDALEVSNPFVFDRWTISPVGKQQIHVSAFQQTRLGQKFDELQVQIGDFEISSVTSQRDEFIAQNTDMARSGDTYVIMNRKTNKVYYSVKGARVGAGSVERAIEGLQEIASMEGIYVDRLIAALPVRLQPANVLRNKSASSFNQNYY